MIKSYQHIKLPIIFKHFTSTSSLESPYSVPKFTQTHLPRLDSSSEETDPLCIVRLVEISLLEEETLLRKTYWEKPSFGRARYSGALHGFSPARAKHYPITCTSELAAGRATERSIHNTSSSNTHILHPAAVRAISNGVNKHKRRGSIATIHHQSVSGSLTCYF